MRNCPDVLTPFYHAPHSVMDEGDFATTILLFDIESHKEAGIGLVLLD